MTLVPDSASATARRRGILLVVGSAVGFCMAAALAKTIGTGLPVAEVIFCRNVFAVAALAPFLIHRHGLGALRTSHPGAHLLRLAFGLVGMFGSFYGYVHLPLATVTALGFAMPLFLTLLSVPLLGERIRWRRGMAVVVGLGGVLLMLRPGAEAMRGDGFAIGLVLAGTVTWALSMITIRRMGDAGERGVTIVLWFAIGGAVVAGLAAIPVWVWPTPLQWVLLAAIGLVSAAAQLMMTEAYRRGETTLLAPFEYSAIVWTTALGFLFWNEVPDHWDFAGIAVLVGAGLYIWHREVTLGIRR